MKMHRTLKNLNNFNEKNTVKLIYSGQFNCKQIAGPHHFY